MGKQNRKYKDTKGRRRPISKIKEYTDWAHGKTFTERLIQIERDEYRITQIRKYINTEMRRKTAVRTNQGLNGTIAHTVGKWKIPSARSLTAETTRSS